MKFGSWLCATALLPILAAGCPGDDDEGGASNTAQDGGSSQVQDAGAGDAGAGSGDAGAGNSDAGAGNSDAGAGSSDAGAGSSGAGAAGSSGAGAGGSGGGAVVIPTGCNWQSLGGQLADAFFRIGATTCRLCSETDRNRSNCIEAPVGEAAVNCIRAAVCTNETLEGPAKRMIGCLDNRHAICNQEAEKSCDNGCLAFSAGDAHKRCNFDMNLGAAMAKCGIDLTTSGLP